jgi:uncharacterized surface protein with fasciclin (FAS1) repeats
MDALTRRTLLSCSTAVLLTAFFCTIARSAPPPSGTDAWTIISSDPQFSDATTLFKYAGLTQYVQNDSFTAFIPTNAAFDKNPGILSVLMPGRNKAFPDTTLTVNFIRSHAILDMHPLSEFSGRTVTLTAISGNPITIDGSQPGTYVITWVSVKSKTATARVVDAPIVTANALIYPVDNVVLTDPQN